MKELALAIQQLQIYLLGIWLRRRYIIVTAWIFCPIGWLLVFNLPPVYRAEAKLVVESSTPISDILAGMVASQNNAQRIQLGAQTLLSQPNLEKIARNTDLDKMALNSKAYEQLINNLRQDIKLTSAGESNIFIITYTNPSPKFALRVVQETLNIFVEGNVGSSVEDTRNTAEFLTNSIAEYEQKLIDAEKRLADFRKENILADIGNEQDFFARIAMERQRLEDAKLNLQELEGQLESAQRQLSGEVPLQDSSGGAFNSQFDERIKTLQARLDSLLISYTEQHPEVVETKRSLESLQQQRKDEIAALQKGGASNSAALSQNQVYSELKLNVARLTNEVQSAKVRVRNFETKLEALKRQQVIIPEIEAKLQGLNRDYDIVKRRYDELVERKESLDLTKKKQQSEQELQFRVYEPPRVPSLPSGPPRILFYTAVLLVGVLAGVFLAFVRSQLNPVVISSMQLKMISDFPVLGSISHTNKAAITRQNRLHFIYFIILSAALVFSYVLFVLNEMWFGITAKQLLGRFL